MPIYEYEPDDRECLMCDGRIEVIQGIEEEPLEFCPQCGLEVRRVISRASFKMARATGADRAADKGLTTFRKTEKGKWEKIAGPGVDMIVGTPEDIAAVEAEKPKKTIDLDGSAGS
ncbi:MAG TPA: zinc ribbon domain-containing protein [Fimbriimonadaceae bacterium]|nr:zinc ribbon domain-containing protein [Fimbriimonadaceae bacterium]